MSSVRAAQVWWYAVNAWARMWTLSVVVADGDFP
jgi:hypothetical protein